MVQNQATASQASDFDRPDLYINRELSWIEFNRRVFEEAQNSREPLLERVKFVSIFETNLDEFIMVRFAALKDLLNAHVNTLSPDGMTPAQQLTAVRKRLAPLMQEVRQYWRTELMPRLAEHHIHILDFEQLDPEQREYMQGYYEREVFPVLTPLAVDPGHPFPHISNLSLNLAVAIDDPHIGKRFARLKIPNVLPRFIPVPPPEGTVEEVTSATVAATRTLVPLEQLIAANLDDLFPGLHVVESYPFHVVRDADIEIAEDEASDLSVSIEQSLRERRFGSVVRLTVDTTMPERIRSLLMENLEIGPTDIYTVEGM